MFDPSFKSSFRTLGSKDGTLIERCISAYYSELSISWTQPATVFDGGAHGGYHSFRMADLLRVKKVIAVEANLKTFNGFLQTVKGNPNGHKIFPVYAALQADENVNEVSFVISNSHPGRSGINPVLRNAAGTTFEEPVLVPATTIDKAAAADRGTIKFIKLDLEGGEYSAFLGGKATLFESRPYCAFENGLHSPKMNNYDLDAFISYMRSAGLVLTTAFADILTKENVGDFWYAFAAPADELDAHVARLRNIISMVATAAA